MGRKIRPGLYAEFEADEGYAALGFVSEMLHQIDTDLFMSDVIEYTHAAMAVAFNTEAAAYSQSNGDRMNHVYEPGHTGIPGFELWEHKLFSGRRKEREAGFEWRPSVLPIEKPVERAKNKKDPMYEVARTDPDAIKNLSDEDYVFRMRAPIMEYGMKVHILPKQAKALFIPTFAVNYHKNSKETRAEAGKWTPRNYRFEKANVPDFSYRNPQEPSGSDGTVGQFSAFWVGWWTGGQADAVWTSTIAPAIQRGLTGADAEALIGRAARRVRRGRRTVNVGMWSFNDAYAAEESGRNLARAFIRGKARSYAQAAKWIRQNGQFGADFEQ